MTDAMIEFRDVSKRYDSLLANDHLSLTIRRGELMTLLGPSGCGKTTALRCLTGYVRPDEGRVFIDGTDITDLPTHQRELGMVFQNFALFPHMTVQDNVGFPLMIRNLGKAERDERVAQALRLVRLEGYGAHYPRQLSGGQQQRVGLARALVYRPKVLLLDEPLSNLDAKLREEMRFEIKEVVTRLRITAVYVTHDQGEALALSDRVAIMNRGRIVALGTSDEIIRQHGSGERLEIQGSEKLANFIKASTELNVEFSDGVISIPLRHKTDALAALEAVARSKMEWGDIRTQRDSLDDVFVKLVSGAVDERGEITTESNQSQFVIRSRR